MPKNAYTIADLITLTGANNRVTFWRWRQKGIIPKPDIEIGTNPVWYYANLKRSLPHLFSEPMPSTNPSA